MPELSRFFGIIIRMFMEVGAQHHIPHFHAYYQGEAGIFSIDPIELVAGSLPKRQRRLVEAWAELHQQGTDRGLGNLATRKATGGN